MGTDLKDVCLRNSMDPRSCVERLTYRFEARLRLPGASHVGTPGKIAMKRSSVVSERHFRHLITASVFFI